MEIRQEISISYPDLCRNGLQKIKPSQKMNIVQYEKRKTEKTGL